jgi:phosphoribosylformylglycinamidine synthase
MSTTATLPEFNVRLFVKRKADTTAEQEAVLKPDPTNAVMATIWTVYDVFGITRPELEDAKYSVFGEAPTDDVLETHEFDLIGTPHFAIEYLPGQYNQRDDSAMQALQMSGIDRQIEVRSSELHVFRDGTTLQAQASYKFSVLAEKSVTHREKDLSTLALPPLPEATPVQTIEGFMEMTESELNNLRITKRLGMNLADLQFAQEYFITEQRDPTEAELKVLDTYWSDHCRHTTFKTSIDEITYPDGELGEKIRAIHQNYENTRRVVHGDRLLGKPENLMDLASINAKYKKLNGGLENFVEEETNACCIRVQVDVDGEDQEWVFFFKNETHNHPTTIAPFGGAATCIGGAIRDLLAGGAYAFQGFRVSLSGDPTGDGNDTPEGRLAQSIIAVQAAKGFSSYGNQIGLATGLEIEMYHHGYVAKHGEVGYVAGAAPVENINTRTPESGDIVLLIGGRTGRDGIGGAVGSSLSHDKQSQAVCGAEVQNGNAIVERKIQRLFRNPALFRLVKKCNDFGAGGVSVAIGEIADSLSINLGEVPLKYSGLNGMEILLSESQERMAVVISKADYAEFMRLCAEENVECTQVADVTDTNRMIATHSGQEVVNLSREFLDSGGVTQQTNVIISGFNGENPMAQNTPLTQNSFTDTLRSIAVALKPGLTDMFDATIGAGTVMMPLGGKNQSTPAEVAITLFPVPVGETHTASATAFGYDPYLSEWSPLFGSQYAIIQSVIKLISAGASLDQIHLTLQEFFPKLNTVEKWGMAYSSMLGAFHAQMKLGIAALGGKDSMSGTLQIGGTEINVPPMTASFAVSVMDSRRAISPEFKRSGSHIYLLKHTPLVDGEPNYPQLIDNIALFEQLALNDKVLSSSTVEAGGVAAKLAKVTLGNGIGVNIQYDGDMLSPNYGSMIIETAEELQGNNLIKIGITTDDDRFIINEAVNMSLDKVYDTLHSTFADLYPRTIASTGAEVPEILGYNSPELPRDERPHIILHPESFAQPRVCVLVAPGTNCENDTIRAFGSGAKCSSVIFRNLRPQDIQSSILALVQQINNSQIFVIPGGFSAADEPDGSAKFLAVLLSNTMVKDSIHMLIDRGGLVLGICNGFQALVKSGLLPHGRIERRTETSPTLTYNTSGSHISTIAHTKIVSNKSPWLHGMKPGDIHTMPVSHGEGRFKVSATDLELLIHNGQVATQYVDHNGILTPAGNINGSIYAIEALTDPTGRIIGKMGHSERALDGRCVNIPGFGSQNIFTNGTGYFA